MLGLTADCRWQSLFGHAQRDILYFRTESREKRDRYERDGQPDQRHCDRGQWRALRRHHEPPLRIAKGRGGRKGLNAKPAKLGARLPGPSRTFQDLPSGFREWYGFSSSPALEHAWKGGYGAVLAPKRGAVGAFVAHLTPLRRRQRAGLYTNPRQPVTGGVPGKFPLTSPRAFFKLRLKFR